MFGKDSVSTMKHWHMQLSSSGYGASLLFVNEVWQKNKTDEIWSDKGNIAF